MKRLETQRNVHSSRLQRVAESLRRPLATLLTTSLLLGTLAGARAEEKKSIPGTKVAAVATLKFNHDPADKAKLDAIPRTSLKELREQDVATKKYRVGEDKVIDGEFISTVNVSSSGVPLTVYLSICHSEDCTARKKTENSSKQTVSIFFNGAQVGTIDLPNFADNYALLTKDSLNPNGRILKYGRVVIGEISPSKKVEGSIRVPIKLAATVSANGGFEDPTAVVKFDFYTKVNQITEEKHALASSQNE